jgi:pimeloyl-ACP methyl ester carboxylesterase
MLEKFHGWTIPGEDVKDLPLDKDLLLTNVMLYWLLRFPRPNVVLLFYLGWQWAPPSKGRKGSSPNRFFLFPKDIALPPPDAWLNRSYGNIDQRHDSLGGGHFAAFEKGEKFVDDVRKCFRKHR